MAILANQDLPPGVATITSGPRPFVVKDGRAGRNDAEAGEE